MKRLDYLNEDWDVLLVLDACRYDVFAEVYEELGGKDFIDGELSKADSNAVNSQGWYWNNFDGRMYDIQLLTTNPKPFYDESKKGPNKGKKLHHNFTEAQNIWAWRGAKPHVILSFFHRYNNHDKRTILHLMPPHLPYLGPEGASWLCWLESESGIKGTTYQKVQAYGRRNGWDEIRRYYKENLMYALVEIQEQLFLIDGKVVITADHAELIGEVDGGEERYHHYPAKDPELRKLLRTVPWLEVGETPEPTREQRDDMQERLNELGFLTSQSRRNHD